MAKLSPTSPRQFSPGVPRKSEGKDASPVLEEIKEAAASRIADLRKAAAIRHVMDEQDTAEGRVSSSAPAPGHSDEGPRRMISIREMLKRMPQA